MKKVCIVTTSEMTMRAFLVDQVRALATRYEVTLVTSFQDQAFWRALNPTLTLVDLPLARPISPRADLVGLLRLIRLFRAERFDAVHSVSPKAGLLSALAGVIAGVPVRLHTFTGQVWAVRRGASRFVLRMVDTLLARLLTHPLVDSGSQREFLRSEGVLRASEGIVLGAGSVSGVDVDRFRFDAVTKSAMRRELGIPGSAIVYLFLGRLNLDKGVTMLASAFRRLYARRPDAWLLVVGADEGQLGETMHVALGPAAASSTFLGHTDVPEHCMIAADVLCLPSRREGFGTVLVEAAAVGLPVVATRIYGITDAVVENEGGLLVAVDDEDQLLAAMTRLADEPETRVAMGARARERAIHEFSQQRLTRELMNLYAGLLDPS